MKIGALLSATWVEGEKSKEFGLLFRLYGRNVEQLSNRGILDESLSFCSYADEMCALLGFFTGLSTLEDETNTPSRKLGRRSFSTMVRDSKRTETLDFSQGHSNTLHN